MRRLLAPVPIAVICAVLALLGVLAYGLAANQPDRRVEAALERGVREPAPPLELPRRSGGGSGSPADYRGKVVVLNFWASWCEPCREESPLLDRWHGRMKRDGGTVLGIDVLDVTSDARDFIRKYELSYPMLRDGDGGLRESYGIVGFPETFLVDRQGRIAAVRRGPVDEAWMRTQVAPLLDEAS
jgi:cytochrome c biogenesis protein CcmG, thiol:disulfide interchange protein DsbE